MTGPNVIHLEHVYSHAPSAVWRALTTPELHARWWRAGDAAHVERDARNTARAPSLRRRADVAASRRAQSQTL